MKKTIGDMISAIRSDRRVTQQELADRIHCTKQTISNYERGIRTPDYATLEAIADALNTTMSMFLSEEEQKTELERIFLSNMASFSSDYELVKRPSGVDTVNKQDSSAEATNDTESPEATIARIFPKLSKAHQDLVLATAEALLAGQGSSPDSPHSADEK